MRALTFQGPRQVRVDTVMEPSIEQPGDALVRVRLTAICGSDLHPYRGDEIGLDPGTTLGHEFVGEVLECGSGVRRFRRGDRVVSPFSTSCGECFYCRGGLTSRCERGELYGWVAGGRGLPGAQAERVRVPLADTTLLAIPAGTSDEQALFCGDVLATGFFCAEMAEVRKGTTAAVVGCGPVGLMAVLAARDLGAERVFAIDLVPERLAQAREYGGLPLALDADPVAQILDATAGRGADAVLEAVGSAAATRLAVDLARPGATVAAAGFHTESRFAVAPGEIYDKNLTYRSGRCPARVYAERLLGACAEGRFNVAPVISHRLPLTAGANAYDMFDRKLDGCVKVVLEP